jgi:hypothetical protein
MNALRTVVAGLAMASTLPTQAADRGFYFGVLGGRADYEFSEPEIAIATIPFGFFVPTTPTPVFTPPGGVFNPTTPVAAVGSVSAAQFAFADPDAEDSDTAWGATVGCRIFDYAAVEVSYLDLGTLHARDEFALPVILGGGTAVLNHELKTEGPAISVLGMMPVAERWAFFLRVGVLFADQKLTRTFSGSGVVNGSNSTTYGSDTALWGGGVQFNWSRWTARLDFQRYSDVGEDSPVGESDIDLLSLGILYRL